jgi:hypothetical protein
MSSFALQPVQQALYSKLTGDGVLMGMISGVYDAPPQHAAVPYVVIGDGAATLKPQVANDVTECDLEVNVWTTASGRKVALAILNRLHGLLHQGSLSVSGFTLLSMVATAADTQLEPNNDRILGRLQITVLVRPV